jgi:YggT family protein
MSAAWLLIKLLDVLIWLVLARVIISWINLREDNPVRVGLERVVDPLMDPLRRYTVVGGMDLAPIVVIFGLSFLQRAIASSLM